MAADARRAQPDAATACRCFLSAALPPPVREVGEERLTQIILDSLGRFTRSDGSVVQKNRCYWTMAKKP